MKYICKSLGKHFNPKEVTVGKVYDVVFKYDGFTFTDDENDIRNVSGDIRDEWYGEWILCDFNEYLEKLKRCD